MNGEDRWQEEVDAKYARAGASTEMIRVTGLRLRQAVGMFQGAYWCLGILSIIRITRISQHFSVCSYKFQGRDCVNLILVIC